MEKYEIHVINPFIYGLNTTPEGGFFSENAIRFLDLQISKNKYRISSYSFRRNYSFLDFEIQRSQYIRPKVTVHKWSLEMG